MLRFSSLSFLKAENAFSGLACVEDVPFRDGAGGQSVEVITNGTGREKPEIGKPVCNPGENAAAVMKGEAAAGIFVNKGFDVPDNTY